MRLNATWKTWTLVAVAATVMSCSTGCQSTADISWDKPPQSQAMNKTVYVKKTEYNGANTTVGNHTWTVFALSGPAILASRQVDERVTKAVHDAYTAAGYTVLDAVEAPANAVIVTPTLLKFHYWSYSWLWPIFIDGGGIRLDVMVESKPGKTLWQKSYDASSFWVTPVACYGFDGKIKGNLTEIVGKIAEDAKSQEVQTAINVTQSPPGTAVKIKE